jgi:hypothetical protein
MPSRSLALAFPEVVSRGFIGVDVFFVISGFLITDIIARQLMHRDFSFADFYWRRVRRLFPALVLVLATTLALGWFVLLPDEFKQLVDAIAVLCAADVCSQRPPGKPILYSDEIHLSPAGARLLVEHTDLPNRISQDLVSADSG